MHYAEDCAAPLPSFQIITFASCEQLANICPNIGCAHATFHTGPSCPRNSLTNVCCSVSGVTLKILIVLSEEHVASVFPKKSNCASCCRRSRNTRGDQRGRLGTEVDACGGLGCVASILAEWCVLERLERGGDSWKVVDFGKKERLKGGYRNRFAERARIRYTSPHVWHDSKVQPRVARRQVEE